MMMDKLNAMKSAQHYDKNKRMNGSTWNRSCLFQNSLVMSNRCSMLRRDITTYGLFYTLIRYSGEIKCDLLETVKYWVYCSGVTLGFKQAV